jgi:hypothetical protein
MNSKKLAGIGISIFALVLGCAGNYAHLKNLSDSESKAIQQELLDNWSDYHISYNSVVIVSDPKNDNKKILIPNYWDSIEGQESMTQLVNGTNKLPNGRINQVWGEPVREIWVNNQFIGYVGHRERELVSAQIIDENTVRLIHTHSGDWRN